MHVLITEEGRGEAGGGPGGKGWRGRRLLEGGEGETKRSENRERELENWEVEATAVPFRRRSIIAKLQKRLLAH